MSTETSRLEHGAPTADQGTESRKRDYEAIAAERAQKVADKAAATGKKVKSVFGNFFGRLGEVAKMTLAAPEMIGDASHAMESALSSTAERVDETIMKAGDSAKTFVKNEYHGLIDNVTKDIADAAASIEAAKTAFDRKATQIRESVQLNINEFLLKRRGDKLIRKLELYNKLCQEQGAPQLSLKLAGRF